MGAPPPTAVVEDGVRALAGSAGRVEVGELTFPPGHVQAPFEPEVPYAGFLLDGAIEKQFARSTWELVPGAAFAMPAGARHGARFSTAGARVLVVWVSPGAVPADVARVLRRPRVQTLGRACALARQLCAELASGDRAWELAAEGLALELLAALARGADVHRSRERAPVWLDDAVALLENGNGVSTLSDVAAAVGVHPSHLARVFRRRYGVSVGAYDRARRLDRAAAKLVSTEVPVGVLARDAGFCDQSHFTRAFVRHTGLTPARYRRAGQAGRAGGP